MFEPIGVDSHVCKHCGWMLERHLRGTCPPSCYKGWQAWVGETPNDGHTEVMHHGGNSYCRSAQHIIDEADPVNHPKHYTSHPSGVECIQITEHMGFNLGNAVKYIWRADLKDDAVEDLRKARWYVDRELLKRGVA
jgi:hypothetical protein